ncbi:unnamed protein product [Meloidogyne enterolobii]|uniref:Uncharacterized protein n=1 Tax=Meloidogyne enterolobii TaxID=390850 RepID=A0ACB0YEV3_MELEN
MKFFSVLIFLIFNSILWSLINSVKNNKNQNELNIVGEASNDLNKILNEGAESSVAPKNKKYQKTLKPKIKINKEGTTTNIKDDKKVKQKEFNKNYYEKNKESLKKKQKEYYQKNKEKIIEYRRDYSRNYKKINKEKIQEYRQKYEEANKEKRTANKRKYRQKKKNEKEILKNDSLKPRNVQDDRDEGTSFINPQNNICENKGKGAIISIENVQLDQANIHFQNATPTQPPHNEEGNLFVDSQMNDCVKNSKLGNIQTDNNKSLKNQQNDDCENKGKEPIVCNENAQLDQGNINRAEEEHLIQNVDNINDDYLNFFYDLNFWDNQNFL